MPSVEDSLTVFVPAAGNRVVFTVGHSNLPTLQYCYPLQVAGMSQVWSSCSTLRNLIVGLRYCSAFFPSSDGITKVHEKSHDTKWDEQMRSMVGGFCGLSCRCILIINGEIGSLMHTQLHLLRNMILVITFNSCGRQGCGSALIWKGVPRIGDREGWRERKPSNLVTETHLA